jgi:hypothetical protein
MPRNVRLAVSLSVVLWILASGICFSQIKSGTITGRVTDATGAVVPGANVTVINEGTKVPLDTQTNGSGDYTVPFLEPGTYDVTISREGFTTFNRTGVAIGVDTTARIDAELSVGRTATVVEVKGAGTVTLQTETATVGDTVASQAIALLPDVNHNPYFYATLQPGVTGRWELMDNSSAMSFGIGMYSKDQFSAISINGAPAYTASISVDGVNVVSPAFGEADVNPNAESIQEVKTYTSDYDASLGRGEGAVAIVTKSGTNSYHGMVIGRLRNDALNANTFANDVQDVQKPAFKVGYYGAAVGGPIKKDKAFFFASWEGMAHNATRQDLLNVPMNNQAKGDFSSPEGCPSLATAEGAAGASPTANMLGTCVSVGGVATPIQLYNPFQASPAPGLSSVWIHPEIVGPNGPSDLTQVADSGAAGPKGLFSYYVPANRWPTDQYNDNNFLFQGLQTFRSQNIISRVDVNHGKNNLYFAGGIEWGTINTPSPWGSKQPFYWPQNGNNTTTADVYTHDPYGSIGDTITVSPTLIVDARIGVQRTHIINMNPVMPGFNYTAVGMPASVQATLPQPGAAPDFSGGSTGQWTSLEAMMSGHKNDHLTGYHMAASATKVVGNWTLKWGGEYIGYLSNEPNVYYSGGYIDPDGCGGCQYGTALDASTAQNATAATQGLGNLGDIMMGAAWWNIPFGQTPIPAFEEQYVGIFTQNTWKVTPRLTVNLGLRWDLQPGPSERFNHMTSLDPTATTNPLCTSSTTTAADAADGLPSNWGCQGAFYFMGLNGNSRHLWESEYNNFGPRLGFAYRMTNSTVVRGGFGMSYLPTNTGLLFGPAYYGMGPWGYGTTNLQFGTSPAGVVVGPMESSAVSPLVPAVGANPAAPQIYGQAQSGTNATFARNYANGRMQQYNLFVEKQVGSWLLSVGYSGARGSHLNINNFMLNGENTALFNAPVPVINCYHAGVNCPSVDSDVATAGGYLGSGVDPYTKQVPNPFNPTGSLPFGGALNSATIPRGIRDGPLPAFTPLPEVVSYGTSAFNSLQVEAKHQFSHGLMLDAFFTWSKELDDVETMAESNRSADTAVDYAGTGSLWNQVDLAADRKYGQDDVPTRLVVNLVYDLPFGRGHSLNPGNKLASYVVSGWSFGATEMDESGYPINIYDNSPGSLDSRPNRAPHEPLVLPKVDQQWYNGKTSVTLPDGRIITPCNYCFLKFNPDAFVAPVIPSPTTAGKYINDTYWLGNSAIDYGAIRDPSINNLNFTIKRSFRVTERLTLELQANATNAFNHPNIRTYTTDLGSSTELTPNNTNNISLGYPTNSSNGFGTHGLTDFDNRQVEFQMRVKF